MKKKEIGIPKFKIIIILLLTVIIGSSSSNSKESLVFENSNFKYEIGRDGKNLHFIDKAAGKDYLNSAAGSKCAYIISDGKIIKEGTASEVFEDVKTIRGANLRLPRIAHLMEILEKEDKLPFDKPYPLTIGGARKRILKEFEE